MRAFDATRVSGGSVDPVKTVKMGANIVISGSDKAAVEAVANALAAKGAKLLSKVEPMGSNWIVTCEDPDDRSRECTVVKLGLQLMIKGPTEEVVNQKVQELVRRGAKLISAPSAASEGSWVAVCDDAGQVYKW
jgi:predicted enzyme related to lactoylglutathione lyase